MARKKEQPKPLFSVKHDFYASLDNFAQEALQLLQTTEMVLSHGAVDERVAPILRERASALRTAMLSADGGH